MNLIQKLKAVMLAKGPAQQIVGELREIKRGWKTPHFWVTLLGLGISLAGSLQGFLTPPQALILNTALGTIFNIFRGAEKADEPGIRPWYQSTEVLIGALGQVNNGVIALQSGGISAPELTTAVSVLAIAMKIARDLSNLQPTIPNPGTPEAPPEISDK